MKICSGEMSKIAAKSSYCFCSKSRVGSNSNFWTPNLSIFYFVCQKRTANLSSLPKKMPNLSKKPELRTLKKNNSSQHFLQHCSFKVVSELKKITVMWKNSNQIYFLICVKNFTFYTEILTQKYLHSIFHLFHLWQKYHKFLCRK